MRSLFRPFFGIAAAVASSALLTAQAQQAISKPAPRPTAAAEAERTAVQLPVTRVSLYKNGVGFFEHTGRVTGDQSVTIDFTTAQLNDVLQSLTAIDLNGGRIAGAGYNSTTPLEQQLKALPLALGEDPTAVDFYNAIRGARVEVRNGTAAAIVGRLLNIEVVTAKDKEGDSTAEKRLITVVAETGEVRTVELTSTTTVRLLDADLHQDVTRYLQLLAGTRNQGLRHLTLRDNGTGARNLLVSYISEVPIWKSTYRILFSDPKAAASTAKQTATLQGWSVVDNTTGTDWVNVQLSLIAGSPQSFIQPLSVPYYSRRPEIPLPQEAQLSPQTHESGEIAEPKMMAKVMAPPAPQQVAMARMNSGSGPVGGPRSNQNQQYLAGVPRSQISAQGDPTSIRYGVSVDAPSDDPDALNAQMVSLAQASINPNTTTNSFDDYFEYKLTEPITIRKNESAMVPILQTKIDTERVTLWSAREPLPLRALWITNTSNLTLDRGSFSIVENGNFGGEGLLDPIHPAEKRLLSYAVDQAVRVSTQGNLNTQKSDRVTATKGVIVFHHADVREVTYVVRNSAAEPRTIVLEHPVETGYTLTSDAKPDETTPAVYRFRVQAAAGQTVRLRVATMHRGTSSYQLTNTNDNIVAYIVSQANNDPAVVAGLQPILTARRKVADQQTALDKVNATLTALRADEDRQRSNVTALTNADKVARERFVRDLNATEDKIGAAQKELAAAQIALQAAKDDLSAKIEAFQIDEKI